VGAPRPSGQDFRGGTLPGHHDAIGKIKGRKQFILLFYLFLVFY
jgi:uncharacterized membrane protein